MINTNTSSISNSALRPASASQSIKNNPYAASSSARPAESPSSVVTISPEAKLAGIGAKYDVTNMTEKEMGGMSQSLFDSGLVGSLEFAVMSFPLDQMRGDIGITTNPSGKINYQEQYKNALLMASQNNASPQEIKAWGNIADVLNKLS